MAALLTGRARLCVVGVLVGWLVTGVCVPGLPNATCTPYSVRVPFLQSMAAGYRVLVLRRACFTLHYVGNRGIRMGPAGRCFGAGLEGLRQRARHSRSVSLRAILVFPRLQSFYGSPTMAPVMLTILSWQHD